MQKLWIRANLEKFVHSRKITETCREDDFSFHRSCLRSGELLIIYLTNYLLHLNKVLSESKKVIMETKKVTKGIGNVTQLIAKLGAATPLDEYENVKNSNLKFFT